MTQGNKNHYKDYKEGFGVTQRTNTSDQTDFRSSGGQGFCSTNNNNKNNDRHDSQVTELEKLIV
jgi:hypothetical protein